MRRVPRSRISRAAASTSSPGVSTATPRLQMSPRHVARGSRFSATTRTAMSWSVTIPLSFPSVSTSTVPGPCSLMARAAA